MSWRKIPLERQVALPLDYCGVRLDCGYRLDVIAYGSVLIEVKSVSKVLPIHRAQVLTLTSVSSVPLR